MTLAARVVALVAGGVMVAGCVPHPVGPARTFGKFEGKATTTAKSALSDVETVRLAAEAAGRKDVFGPYLSVLLSEAEESIAGAQGTFNSIQPPDDAADALADKLDGLLSDALDHVRQVRIAVRRGESDTLADEAAPLADDAASLDRFVQAHR